MKASRGLVAALATLVSTGVCARDGEPDVGGFKSYVTPAYTIVTHDNDSALQIPSAIAKIDAVLAKLLNGSTHAERAPTYIILAPENLWAGYLEPGTGISSEYVPGRFVNYILIRNCNCETNRLRTAMFHEYTHLYLHTQFRGVIPLWFDEGMARLITNTDFRGGRAILGLSPEFELGWIPLDQLLRLDKSSPEYRSSALTWTVHNESWALVHRGMIDDAEFRSQMFSFLDALNDLKTVDEAAQSSFGRSVQQLDRELYSYAARSSYKTMWTNVEWATPAPLGAGRDMGELESLELIADVMFVSGFKPERVLSLINAAQRVAPNSPAVRVLRLRMAVRDRDDAGIDWLLERLEPSLTDPTVARGVGLALFERVRGRRADDPMTAEKAQALRALALTSLDRTLRARPDDLESSWAFGMLAASTRQLLGPALQRLLSASENQPQNADISMATALVYEALGKRQETFEYLQKAERNSHSVEQHVRARQRLATFN